MQFGLWVERWKNNKKKRVENVKIAETERSKDLKCSLLICIQIYTWHMTENLAHTHTQKIGINIEMYNAFSVFNDYYKPAKFSLLSVWKKR